MELYVLDKDLNRIGIIDNYQCLVWVRKYYKPSSFSLEIIPELEQFELLRRGNYLVKGNNLNECMYIDHRELSENDDLIETLVVRGYSPSQWYSRRITLIKEFEKGKSEDIVRTYVNRHCINPVNVKRKIPRLSLGPYKGLGKEIDYSSHYKPLDEEIELLATMSELGYRTNFDLKNKSFTFEVYQGLDRTSLQKENTRAIFSTDFENISDQRYVDSSGDYRSTALIAGAGEDAARKTTLVGDEYTGLDRYEIFVDARDISDTKEDESVIPDSDYIELLKARGKEKLSEYSIVESFDANLLNTESLTYKEDFDLGDKITLVNNQWNLILHERIIEIEETYNAEGLSIDIRIGNNIPTLIDKIRRKVK